MTHLIHLDIESYWLFLFFITFHLFLHLLGLFLVLLLGVLSLLLELVHVVEY